MARPRVAALLAVGVWIVVVPGARGDPAPIDDPGRDQDREQDREQDQDQVEAPAHAGTGEVIVVEAAAPVATTATSRLVSAETLAVTPTRSAEDLLVQVPGLHMSQHGSEGKGQQFFLRGFDAVHGSDLEVRVAGISINELSNVHGQGYVDLGFVIPETVISLRADKGSFGLDQGAFATAGSVELELGVPAAARGYRAAYQIGTTNRHRLLAIAAPRGRPDSDFVAIEAMHDDGYGQHRSVGRLVGLGQMALDLPAAFRCTLVGTAYGARFEEPGVVPLADYQAGKLGFYDSYVDGGGDSQRMLAGMRCHRDQSGATLDLATHGQWRFLELREDFTGFLLYPDTGDTRRQRHRSTRGNIEGRWSQALTRTLSLVAGADFTVDRLHQSEDQLTLEGVAWRRNRSLWALELLYGGRIGGQMRLGSWLEVDLGLRADAVYVDADDRLQPERSDAATTTALSPRLAATYRPGGGWALYASAGRGVRPPEARAVTTPEDTENVENTQYLGGPPRITESNAAELGARWRAGRIDAGVAGFYIDISNEMVFDHVSGINLALNRTRRVGVEADLELALTGLASLRADVTAVDAHFVESGNPVPNAPTLIGRVAAELGGARGWRGSAQLEYVGARPLAHGATGSATALVGVLAGYRRTRWAVDLQIDNALATHYYQGEYHYASWFDTSEPRSQLPRIHYAAGPPFGLRLTLTSWL